MIFSNFYHVPVRFWRMLKKLIAKIPAGAATNRISFGALQLKKKLKLNCAAVQYPIGLETELQGLVDLVQMKAFISKGAHG